MPTNVFFDTGTKNEQDLYEAIAIEQIKIQGQEVFYLPRKLVAEDNLFTEDRLSTFNDAYLIEMVFNETDGFGGEKELMGKFGLEEGLKNLFQLTQTLLKVQDQMKEI